MNIQMSLNNNDYVGETIKKIQQQAMFKDLCVRFSGGKDSIVIKHLMDLAGVNYKYRFSRTSVDPPELLKFINTYYKDVIVEKPRITMFNMIIKKGFPPTRICRYCCKEFKERNTCKQDGEVWTCTGVRKEESKKRSSRSMIETCQSDKGIEFFHPIVNWTEDQVWKFINDERIPYCDLYDEGFDRIGCVGCPLTSSKKN